MENLAGAANYYTTKQCYAELDTAGINVVPNPVPEHKRGEVNSNVIGELHGFTFKRNWYYWVVEGEMPLWAAEAMYVTQTGAKDVRVAGHCGCPPPREWVRRLAPDHVEVVEDPDGSIEAEFDEICESVPSMKAKKPRFVPCAADIPDVRAIIDTYHVDSPAGLKLIANMIRMVSSGATSTADL